MSKIKELETRISDLEQRISYLRKQLVEAKVLCNEYKLGSLLRVDNFSPISLVDMKDQLEAIKSFLGVKLVIEPEIPAKKIMRKISERS